MRNDLIVRRYIWPVYRQGIKHLAHFLHEEIGKEIYIYMEKMSSRSLQTLLNREETTLLDEAGSVSLLQSLSINLFWIYRHVMWECHPTKYSWQQVCKRDWIVF